MCAGGGGESSDIGFLYKRESIELGKNAGSGSGGGGRNGKGHRDGIIHNNGYWHIVVVFVVAAADVLSSFGVQLMETRSIKI